MALLMIKIEDAQNMKANMLKENLCSRVIPSSGAKYALIESLSDILNDNVAAIDPKKIVALLPVLKKINNTRN